MCPCPAGTKEGESRRTTTTRTTIARMSNPPHPGEALRDGVVCRCLHSISALAAALPFTFSLFAFALVTLVTTITFVTLVTAPAASAAECKVLDPELQGFYEGGCKHGLAEGEGLARGTAEYQGEFHKGMKHGKGVKTWAWGDRYAGSFANDRRNGKGMYVWGARSPWAGERYVGDYVADQREGFGTYYWPSGDRYDGVWKRDRRYGYSAMEERRQVAEAARASALTNGAQVCSWGRVGIAYKILRIGRIETLQENAVQVRLIRLEGVPEALSGSSLQPGQLVDSTVTDWTPCS